MWLLIKHRLLFDWRRQNKIVTRQRYSQYRLASDLGKAVLLCVNSVRRGRSRYLVCSVTLSTTEIQISIPFSNQSSHLVYHDTLRCRSTLANFGCDMMQIIRCHLQPQVRCFLLSLLQLSLPLYLSRSFSNQSCYLVYYEILSISLASRKD